MLASAKGEQISRLWPLKLSTTWSKLSAYHSHTTHVLELYERIGGRLPFFAWFISSSSFPPTLAIDKLTVQSHRWFNCVPTFPLTFSLAFPLNWRDTQISDTLTWFPNRPQQIGCPPHHSRLPVMSASFHGLPNHKCHGSAIESEPFLLVKHV